MKKLVTTISTILLLTNMVNAQAPAGYYDSATGLSGSSLKTALNTIIKGHHSFLYTDNYTDVWDILKQTDKDPNNSNNVILLYSGWSVNAAQEYNNANGWSREHVWAKSRGIFYTGFGDEDDVAATDVHHLRPADISVNSARGNRWFDYATIPYVDEGVSTGSFTSSDAEWVWQPRPEVVGDVARMMFYMATRYEGLDGEPDLELINDIPSDRYTNLPVHAKLSTLLAWHAADTVDAFERNRNNVIYSYQGNRNPFIDHPEYADLMWNGETVVSFEKQSLSVIEDHGTLWVNIDIEYPDTTATSFDVSIQSGNAILGTDYQVTMPKSLSFPANSYASLAFPITILDDTDLDGSDTLIFELTNISGGNNATISNPATFQLIILDNEINSGERTGNIIISEIADATYTNGKPKYLELTNTGAADATLTGFVVNRYSGSGSTPDDAKFTFPEFVLPAGRSAVLTNATEAEWITYTDLPTPAYITYGLDYGIGPILGNGNDTYELRDNNNNVLDLYGYIGVDGLGTVWEYTDSYAYRNAEIIGGSAEFNPAEWTIAAVDFLDDKAGSFSAYLTPGTHSYVVSAVENEQRPEKFILNQNFPNPFNPSTIISYTLPEQSSVELRVFDVRGNEVVMLQQDVKSPGSYDVLWNGMDQFGNPVHAGLYFAKLQTANSSQTIKMVYLK